MRWFYAEAGEQKGPVTDDQFDALLRDGIIQPNTLVWHEGMANWQPLESVRPLLPPRIALPEAAPVVLPPGAVACVECGQPFPKEETVQIGGVNVCPACKPTYVQKLREGKAAFVSEVESPSDMRFAGFWIRVGAYMIDQLILMIVGIPFSIYFGFRMQEAMAGGQFDWGSYLANYGLLSGSSMALSLLYHVLFVGRYGATPGKLMVRIKIVTADGQKVSYLRALGRFGGLIVSSFTCMLGCLLPIWDKERRALHDYMCHTRVVYK